MAGHVSGKYNDALRKKETIIQKDPSLQDNLDAINNLIRELIRNTLALIFKMNYNKDGTLRKILIQMEQQQHQQEPIREQIKTELAAFFQTNSNYREEELKQVIKDLKKKYGL